MVRKIDPRIKDKWWRLNHLYKIIDKEGKLITFRCNEEQTELFNKYEKKKAASDYGLREDTLKARQIGFTTFHCIYYFDAIYWSRNKSAKIVAHKQALLEEIFEKVKIAYKYIPAEFKLKAKNDTAHKLSFDETNSSIQVTLDARGTTPHYLHVAEIAHHKDIVGLSTGTFMAMPMSADITTETTANGYNHYRSHWYNNDDEVWSRNFFSWMKHKEYRLTDGKSSGAHDDYLDEIGADTDQRRWWYRKYAVLKTQGAISKFDYMLQENPARPEDAFISTGRSVMPGVLFTFKEPKRYELISDKRTDVILDPVTGIELTAEIAERNGIDFTRDIIWFLQDSKTSPLQIWHEVEEAKNYVIGADVAEGLAKGDYSCAYVVDCEDFKVVAKWHGHTAPDMFGKDLVKIARYYNDALIAPEVNNHGIATVNAIKGIYDNIYFREYFDEIADNYTKKLGWLTNMKTKSLMISELYEALRDNIIEIHDEPLLAEIRSFVYDDNGHMNASSGCYDDMIIALAIAIQAYKSIL